MEVEEEVRPAAEVGWVEAVAGCTAARRCETRSSASALCICFVAQGASSRVTRVGVLEPQATLRLLAQQRECQIADQAGLHNKAVVNSLPGWLWSWWWRRTWWRWARRTGRRWAAGRLEKCQLSAMHDPQRSGKSSKAIAVSHCTAGRKQSDPLPGWAWRRRAGRRRGRGAQIAGGWACLPAGVAPKMCERLGSRRQPG